MHLSVATITSLPKLGVTHSPQEVANLLCFILGSGLDLQSIDLLQDFGLLIQEQTQGYFLFFLLKLRGSLDLLCLIEAPSLKLIVEDLEILVLLGVHAALNLLLMLYFLLVAKVGLLGQQFVISVVTLLAQTIGCSASKPSTDMALDLECGGLSLLVPHGR